MKKIFSILLVGLSTFSFGQFDRSVIPQPAKAPTINIGESQVFTTSNGITVILSENHKLPRVTFDLNVGPDANLEGNKAGLSSLAGSLVMSGTNNRTKDELDLAIDNIGASLSAGSNSITLTCLTKHMSKGLDLMSDVLLNANFPQSEYDRIVKQMESNLISTKSSPAAMASNAAAKANFEGHPFGEVMTEASLKAITRDDVLNYYKSTFVPYQSYLVVVGDITREQTEAAVNQFFGNWNGTKWINPSWKFQGLPSGNRVLFVKKPGAVQSTIYLTFPVDLKPGDQDQIAVSVMNGIFGGGGFGNRMIQNLREDKAFTYGAGSRIAVETEGSYFRISGDFRNDVTDSAIHEMLFELGRIAEEMVTDEELNLTKSSMAGSFARSLESPATVARFAYNTKKYGLDKNYYQNYLKNLEAVTKDDVLLMAQKYLTAANCNIVVVGNEEIVDRLKKFDADGKIEMLDAFGNEAIERKSADISAEQLLKNYVYALMGTTSDKVINKKLKKIKSMKQELDYTNDQIPFPLNSETVWIAPNIEGMKLKTPMGVMQQSFFDGKAGYNQNMQTGREALTEDEIKEKNLSTGLIPEWNYSTSGMAYKLLGIEGVDGQEAYVLELQKGENKTYDYFLKSTYLKVRSVSIMTEEGQTNEVTTNYSNYKAVNGIQFPHGIDIVLPQFALKGEVKNITFNKANVKDY